MERYILFQGHAVRVPNSVGVLEIAIQALLSWYTACSICCQATYSCTCCACAIDYVVECTRGACAVHVLLM